MKSENDTSPIDVLVVDDDKGNLQLLISILSEAGYNVRPASTGELALRSVQSKLPALILLDVKLPDIDGFEICRRLKADSRTSSIPVVFITILESASEKVKGFQAGGVDYITKPFNKEEILARVHAQTKLRLAQLAIETYNTTLTQMNKRLEITNRLFAFLSEVNQTIVRVKERDELFRAICRITVEFGKFRMAWIGLFDGDNGLIKPYTHFGHEDGYLASVLSEINDKSGYIIPNQMALREGKVVTCEDVETYPGMLPHHREEALKRGYQSFVAVPLKLKGDVIGNLTIYATEKGSFSAAEQRLFIEVGEDISFALDAFETTKEHLLTVGKLVDSEIRYRRLFETAQDAILILDEGTGKIIDANPCIKDLLGYSMEELLGKNLWEIGELKDTLASKISNQQLQRDGYIRYDHLTLITKDGRQIAVEVVANAYQVDRQRVIHCNIRDVTERKRAEEKANQEAVRRRILVDQSSDGIVVLDINGKVYEANQEFARMLGYSQAEILQLSVWDWENKFTPEKLLEMIQSIDEKGDHFETQHRRKNGTIYDVEISTNGALFGGQKLVFCTCRDITERKRLAEELRALLQHQETILAAVPDIIMEVDNNKIYTWANPEGIEFFGEDIIGREASFYFVGKQNTYQIVQPIFHGSGETIYVESWQRRKDGESRLLAWWCRTLKDTHGNVIGSLSAARDITEIKIAEDALRSRTAFLESLLNTSIDGILVVGSNRKKHYINRRFIDIFSVPQHIMEDPDDLALREYIKGLTANPYLFLEKIIYVDKHLNDISHDEIELKSGLFLDRYSAPVLDMDGNYFGRIWTFRDITERKKAEAGKVEMEALKRTNQAKSDLLANVSHELRTPLTSIKGNLETLLEPDVEWSKDQQTNFLQSANIEADRLTLLIRDLLDMSRIESGKLTLDKRTYPVSEILDSVSGVLTVISARHKLKTILAPDLPPVEADEVRIGQIITNLVENAAKFSSEGSEIVIEVQAVNDSIIFSVEDSGIGMPPEVVVKLFDRFYQSYRVTEGKTRGTGLGLAICKGIVEAHGGKIWVESQPEKGSSFKFSLPVNNQQA